MTRGAWHTRRSQGCRLTVDINSAHANHGDANLIFCITAADMPHACYIVYELDCFVYGLVSNSFAMVCVMGVFRNLKGTMAMVNSFNTLLVVRGMLICTPDM